MHYHEKHKVQLYFHFINKQFNTKIKNLRPFTITQKNERLGVGAIAPQ